MKILLQRIVKIIYTFEENWNYIIKIILTNNMGQLFSILQQFQNQKRVFFFWSDGFTMVNIYKGTEDPYIKWNINKIITNVYKIIT